MCVLHLKCFLFVYLFKGITLTEFVNDEATSWNWSAMQWKEVCKRKKTEQLATGNDVCWNEFIGHNSEINYLYWSFLCRYYPVFCCEFSHGVQQVVVAIRYI